MNQDEALEKWIDHELPQIPIGDDAYRQGAKIVCREAWHAAVKHTLEFVAAELRISLEEEFQFAEKVADQVLKMKP